MRKLLASAGIFIQFTSFAFASDPTLQDLHLVIGSTRGGYLSQPLAKRVYQEANADLSHAGTFSGKAITVDIAPCENPKLAKRHWQADAETFEFPGTIQNVYLERLFTFDQKSGDHTKDHISNVLQNLTKHMIPAQNKVEIEWHPCVGMAYLPPKASKEEREHILNTQRRQNPFQGVMDINEVLTATKLAVFDSVNLDGVPNKSYIDAANAFKKPLTQLINFYVGSKPSLVRTQLIQRLRFEANVLTLLSQDPNKRSVPLLGSITADFGKLDDTTFSVVASDPEDDGKILVRDRQGYSYLYDTQEEVAKAVSRGGTVRGVLHGYMSFMTGSCLNFLWSDMAVEIQKGLVQEKLASLGFRAIEIKRKKSPHNRRQNVHIISTVYDPGNAVEEQKA
ncbi:MAG: hypothetical protein C0514_02320 [Candidatus Puniceispirillum sp.]|nr:hypothetical protein [Candidatus Puniceispirillum sp.]